MSAQDPLSAYFLMNSALLCGAIDISALVCGLCRSKTRGAAVVTRASSKNPQRLRLEPPRITSNVKLNLQFLKRIKEKRAGVKPSTGYRRKKVERDSSQDVDEEENTSFYDSNSYVEIELTRSVLLVDGYNMCGYWSKLKKHFKRGHLDYARQTLLEELVGFSAIRGTKVVVVFDAAASGLPDHKETYQGLDVVFSASSSADIWIEKEGAFVWSCRFLVSAIKDAKKERDEILLEMTSYSMKGKLLEDNLDPEVCLALKMLKKQLLQAEAG